ncbi:MAG: primosomal protein N' [Syntrophus sp. SKADARSKE-3]|nr:primosomal protein N' [Syntrophus sp. SKADARSKE-3]
MFVKVAVNIPTDKTFTYHVPEALAPAMAVGRRVLMPFGHRRLTGYVLDVTDTTEEENIKDIIDISDPSPLFAPSDLIFYRWVADYYLHPLGKTLGEILPGEDLKSARRVRLSPSGYAAEEDGLTGPQQEILNLLKTHSHGLPLSSIKRRFQHLDVDREIKALCGKGYAADEEYLNGRVVAPKSQKIVYLADAGSPDGEIAEKLTTSQLGVISMVRQHGGMTIPRLMALSGHGRSVIAALIQKGILAVQEQDMMRCVAPVTPITAAGNAEAGDFQPNMSQMKALRGILKGLSGKRFSPCLLHGVTGSGKTEVYFLAMEAVLKENGGILFLVPEIGLTPQLLGRLHERFPQEPIAVLHSGISHAVRYDQWRSIREGTIRVVVGARSALFAPVRDLRLVIVDEEHDESYKQDDRMRYNARDLAVVKARMAGATVVLGSATPAVQSYYNTRLGKYKILTMANRVEERPMPEIEIVDMRLPENGDGGRDAAPILSRRLKEALRETLDQKKQALLLLNRRGFSTFMLCRDCGYVMRCRNCDLTLTLHAREEALTCHYCDFTVKAAGACPECGGKRFAGYGVGTERLEEMIRVTFPDARVARMDRDTTSRVGAHEGMLRALGSREIDILVGTQMISKGHDFPGVVLVGVISADTSLNIPDFRASEKTFQLLTQVSGRGGRGDTPGRVIIQTFNPGHYVLKRVKDHDYKAFYDEEMALRNSLAYPPCARMINLRISCIDKDKGWKAAREMGRQARDLARQTKAAKTVDIIGPAESPLARIRGRYRWQLLLKGYDSGVLRRLAQEILSCQTTAGISVVVDVDPMNFM